MKFEYLRIEENRLSQLLDENLNELGNQGWELVCAVKEHRSTSVNFIFKRALN
jgi:hypothetical protein